MKHMQRTPAEIAELIERHAWVRSLARTLVADSNAADDLVQDAWIAAIERGPDGDGRLRGWLARVVRNLARQRWRSTQRRVDRERLVSRPETLEDQTQLFERYETYELVVKAVGELDEPYRRVVLLRYFEGRSTASIAQSLGVSIDAVEIRLRRALDKLRDKLDRKGGREHWLPALAQLARTPSGTIIGVTIMKTWVKVALAIVALGLLALIAVRTISPSQSAAPSATPPGRAVAAISNVGDREVAPRQPAVQSDSGRSRAESHVQSVRPALVQLVVCATDSRRGGHGFELIELLRQMGPVAVNGFIAELREGSSFDARSMWILRLMDELGNVGATVEDDLVEWGRSHADKYEMRDVVKALLSQGTPRARTYAVELAGAYRDEARRTDDIECRQSLQSEIAMLGNAHAEEALPLLAAISDEVEVIVPPPDLDKILVDDPLAYQSFSDRYEWNSVSGDAIDAIAQIDSPESVATLERMIENPTNAQQREYALKSTAEAVARNSTNGIGSRFVQWSLRVLADPHAPVDQPTLATALDIASRDSGHSLPLIVAMRARVDAMDTSLRNAWISALAQASAATSDPDGLALLREQLANGRWPNDEDDADRKTRTAIVSALARSPVSADAQLIESRLSSGSAGDVKSVLDGAPSSFWISRAAVLEDLVARLSGTPGVARETVASALDRIFEISTDPVGDLDRCLRAADSTLSAQIKVRAWKKRLSTIRDQDPVTALASIADLFPFQDRHNQDELLATAWDIGQCGAIDLDFVTAFAERSEVPLQLRVALVNGFVRRDATAVPHGIRNAVPILASQIATPFECQSVLRLFASIMWIADDDRAFAREAVAALRGADGTGSCGAIGPCLDAFERAIE